MFFSVQWTKSFWSRSQKRLEKIQMPGAEARAWNLRSGCTALNKRFMVPELPVWLWSVCFR